MAKKVLYITLFTFLGFLVQLLVHAVIEMVYIKLLLTRYDTFGLGLPFSTWFLVHNVFTLVLLALGVVVGFWQGIYWWKRLYGESS